MNYYIFDSSSLNFKTQLIQLNNGSIYLDLNELESIFSISFKEWENLPENIGLKNFRSIMYFDQYNYKSPKEFEEDILKKINGKLYCAYNYILSYINYNNEELLEEIDSFIEPYEVRISF